LHKKDTGTGRPSLEFAKKVYLTCRLLVSLLIGRLDRYKQATSAFTCNNCETTMDRTRYHIQRNYYNLTVIILVSDFCGELQMMWVRYQSLIGGHSIQISHFDSFIEFKS
jgi:hypothetical protein